LRWANTSGASTGVVQQRELNSGRTEVVLDTLRGAEKIAVVIVNYNGGALLERCLTALVKQTYTPFRTIVVDNASRDGSVDGIEGRHPAVQVIRMPKNIGFAAGNNVGIRPTEDCDWIACLNPDAFPEPDWLEQFVKAMRQAPTRSFFGCKMLKAENPDWLDGTGDVYHVSGLAWRRDHGKPVSKDVYSIRDLRSLCGRCTLSEAGIIGYGRVRRILFLLLRGRGPCIPTSSQRISMLVRAGRGGTACGVRHYWQAKRFFGLSWTPEYGLDLFQKHASTFAVVVFSSACAA
jgi:glycosyltransferase involved in cell wall biosynthesis